MTSPRGQVPNLVEQIGAEIKALRKGRGLQAGDLEHRLGPLLTELATGSRDADQVLRRHKLTSEITTCGAHMAADLRAAILASLALSTQTRQMPYFKDRVSWLAAHLGYEYRTALRRIDTAEQLLSEEIARELTRRRGRMATTPDGWRLDELKTLVRLDTPTPQAYEHRRIVATRPDLTEVVAWMDVPPGPGQARGSVSVEVLYGGRLERKEQPSSSLFQFVVQLPTSLQPGEEHEYGLLLRIPEGESMRPRYIFCPECPCNVFDLRARFGPDDRPAWIRRVDGETVRMLDTAEPANDLALDEAGELHLRFNSPTMYLCYGVQWGA